MPWQPQRGPQSSALLARFCDELFYGGERGGGKSDFQLGYQEDGALRYGGKSRGIMFRKTYAELEELQARASELFPAEGAVYKTQPSSGYPFSNCWYWPNGATVKMRFIEHARDYGRYHGHQYCVAHGTMIAMADGSQKAIENIKVGDLILTLEGEKPVTAVMAPYMSPCVTATVRDARGRVVGSQVHPVRHPVLTSVSNFSELPDAQYRTVVPLLQSRDPWQSYESLSYADPDSLVGGANQVNGRSGCKESADGRRDVQRLAPLTCQVVLASQVLRSSRRLSQSNAIQSNAPCKSDESFLASNQVDAFECGDQTLLAEHIPQCTDQEPESWRRGDPAYGLIEKYVIPNFQSGYQFYRHLHDEQLPNESAGDRYCAQLPGDAGVLNPGAMRSGETDCIREYIRQEPCRYIHPYTKEQRIVEVETELGTVDLEPCRENLVFDITVKDANHYISSSGLINKNTHISFDEVTEYDTPSGLLKMMSTLRSAHGVPCTVRLTGNPGGVGHIWVKARYIDVAPPMHPYVDEDTGFTRMFVPSKLSDNVLLMQSDPSYRSRILAATGGNDALRKAWLEGDWNVVAGAFFDCWRNDKHVIKPFTIPENWARFRSFDWGSARPFSVGWWAISSGDLLPDGRQYPRGALIRYKEWYGMKPGQPNVGLKMDAEEVAKGIVDRSGGEEYVYSVADPACARRDGGPSIKERMFNAGEYPSVLFRDADNSRVAGWDQVRSRLIGDDEPMIYTFDTCVDSIRTVPLMQHDEHKIEDINTAMEDHAADDWRYACMSRPFVRAASIPTPSPRFAFQQTISEIIASQRRKRQE